MKPGRWLLLAGCIAGMAVAGQGAPPGIVPAESPAATGTPASHGTAIDEKELAALVAQLGDASFAVREAASQKLEAMGKGIYPMLRKQKANDPEVAARIAAILDKMAPLWDGKESVAAFAKRAGIERVSWKLELGPKKVPLELALVPAGKFAVRSKEVTIAQPFYLGVSHVTVDQFAAFVAATDYRTDAEKKGSAIMLLPKGGGFANVQTPGASWRNPGFPQAGDHPAVEITWNDAKAFCAWASKESGRMVCLPTDTQWEFACRAGKETKYIWGDEGDVGQDWANVSDVSLHKEVVAGGAAWDYFDWDDGFVYTAPVKSFKPNGFGLYDMIGNAWQWCDDPSRQDDGNPAGDAGARGFAWNASRVLRGASWNSRPFTCEMSYGNLHPADYAYNVGGFRVEVVLDERD